VKSDRPVPSRRELQILRLVADGLTSKDIGRQLQMDARTVDNLLQRLARRWDARSRAHTVALGFRKQLLK
jgi:LuxR family transcriptional regulator